MSIIEENWSYRLDIKNESYLEFESRLLSLRDDVLNERGDCVIQNYKVNRQNQNEELQLLLENNQQLRHNIKSKLDELSKQKNLYENLKKERKLQDQELKDTHEAFLMAKKYYKKFLKVYYRIESRSDEKQTIFVQFFTETKKELEHYSVRLLRNTKTDHYELLETKPVLSMVEELKTELREFNDLPSTLCSIRQAFLKLKKK